MNTKQLPEDVIRAAESVSAGLVCIRSYMESLAISAPIVIPSIGHLGVNWSLYSGTGSACDASFSDALNKLSRVVLRSPEWLASEAERLEGEARRLREEAEGKK